MRYSNQPIYQRRRRIALLIFVLLLLVVLYMVGLGAEETDDERLERVDAPTVEQAPEAIDERTVAEEETVEEEAKE